MLIRTFCLRQIRNFINYSGESHKEFFMSMKIVSENVTISDFIEKYLIGEIKDNVYFNITAYQVEAQAQVTVYADPKFQRKYGAWNKTKKSKYIESVFQNRICTQIVLASCTDSYKLKNGLAVNIDWTILDGMHRSNVIKEFVNNEFGFTGYASDGRSVVYCENRKFSSLSDRVQKIFLRKPVEVKLISDISEDRYSEIFITINDGEALNNQERLNAIDCEMSTWTRKIEDLHIEAFTRMPTRSNLHRMSAREFTSKIYINTVNLNNEKTENLNNKTVSNLYRDSKEEPFILNSEVVRYLEDNFFNSISNIARSLKKNISTRSVWVFSMVHHLFHVKNGLKYSDISETFTDEVLWSFSFDTLSTLLKQSKTREVHDELNETPGRSGPYFHCEIGRYHMAPSSTVCTKAVLDQVGDSIEFINFLKDFEKSQSKESVA